jgi:hypothetical protein
VIRLNTRGVTRPVLNEGAGGSISPAPHGIGIGRLSTEHVEVLILAHLTQEFLGEMFFIGKDEGLLFALGREAQNMRRHMQQFG